MSEGEDDEENSSTLAPPPLRRSTRRRHSVRPTYHVRLRSFFHYTALNLTRFLVFRKKIASSSSATDEDSDEGPQHEVDHVHHESPDGATRSRAVSPESRNASPQPLPEYRIRVQTEIAKLVAKDWDQYKIEISKVHDPERFHHYPEANARATTILLEIIKKVEASFPDATRYLAVSLLAISFRGPTADPVSTQSVVPSIRQRVARICTRYWTLPSNQPGRTTSRVLSSRN